MRRLIALAAVFSALPAFAWAEPPSVDAQALRAAVVQRFAPAAELKGAGYSRVAVDHSFERGASGAVGFLCARPDSLDSRAASSPTGSDPHGRFLGARLSFAFR